MAMRWPSILAPAALVVAASGCLGSAGAPTSSPAAPSPTVRLRLQPYALVHVRGTYTTGSSTNHFGGDVHRYRFPLGCRPSGYYARLVGPVSWQERLCMAILDYRRRTPVALAAGCGCPVSQVAVDVRGTIRGRPFHERFTPCLCGDGHQAAADARIILLTHPKAPAM
jgi:hypothetical protein